MFISRSMQLVWSSNKGTKTQIPKNIFSLRDQFTDIYYFPIRLVEQFYSIV